METATITTDKLYLQNKARMYMLNFFTDTDCINHFFCSISHNFSKLNLNFGGFDDDYGVIASFVGFIKVCPKFDYAKKDKNIKDIATFCKAELESLQEKERRGEIGFHKILDNNLKLLADTLHLNDAEIAILNAAVIGEEVAEFEAFIDKFSRKKYRLSMFIVSKMLGFPYGEITSAMSGSLRELDIINENELIDFVRGDFVDILLSEIRSKDELIENFVVFCDESALDVSDYSHIKELDALLCYLKFAKDSARKGVNILIYGEAGTGKSEFAKILSKSIGSNLSKVRTSDNDGRILDGIKRISSYLLAQKFLDAKKDILLYDEVEDILNCENDRLKNKAFLNETLETNAIPTIWITNNIDVVDNAVVRRFDFAIAMNIPKKRTRKEMLVKICGDKLDKKTLKLTQKSPYLAPALINKANEISSVIEGDYSKNFLMILNDTLKAQGYCEIKKQGKGEAKNMLPKSYSLDFINTDCDISSISSGLQQNPNARICLYGLSGTGKSAFAQFIAKSLKRPCIIKSVSDLESMWVGATEQNIAKAFKEAKAKKAVLVFDEADSFLRDRRFARQGFEQTKVNEMLVQMERFNGIFIATTNLMDNIDKSALRRFDLKVEFKALNATQRINLFKIECKLLGLKYEMKAKGLIERLECLTTGDFAAVKRQHSFSPIKDALDFYGRLCEEVKVKDLQSENVGVGFLR